MTRNMSAYEIVVKLARLVEIGRSIEKLVREAEAIGRRFDVESARSPKSLVHTPMTCGGDPGYDGPREPYELREAVSQALDDSPYILDGVATMKSLARELREFLKKMNGKEEADAEDADARPVP